METTKKYLVGLDYSDLKALDTLEEALTLIKKLMTEIVPTDRITVRTIHTSDFITKSNEGSIEHNFLFDEH